MNLTVHRGCFAPSSTTSPQLFESTRPMSLALSQNKNLSVLAYVEVFWWARVDVASRASKKAPQGLFCPPDYSAGRCCSNPPSRGRLKMPGKTKNQRNFYAGPFGGRGWIRTTEAESSRFTVCPHWPLGNTPIFSFAVHGLPVYITTRMIVCQHLLRNFWIFVPKAKVQKQKPPRNQRS